jgi:hypothetical protein
MLNGMTRFPGFPAERFRIARDLLCARLPGGLPDAKFVELDCGRLFQGLWLDRYEQWMPKYGGKNLACVACKLAMHTRAILHCLEHGIPRLTAGYARRQQHYPEQQPVFMDRMASYSGQFGVETSFPLYEELDDEHVTRHVLEEFGLPSAGGGERKCLFCQTLTTATEKEIGRYVDDMLPKLSAYIEHKLAGRIREAAAVFAPPGPEP